jgi:hypothetical protein
MSKILIIALICAFTTPAFAQKLSKEEKIEKIRTQKIAFITNKIDLTSQEAQVFWPVYNEFLKKRDALSLKRNKANRELAAHKEDYSDAQKTKLIDEVVDFRLHDANLRKEYHQRFKSVLPIDKVIKLYQAENQFKNYLLKQIKGQKEKGSISQKK